MVEDKSMTRLGLTTSIKIGLCLGHIIHGVLNLGDVRLDMSTKKGMRYLLNFRDETRNIL